MKAKSIRTIAGLQRLYDAENRRTKKFYARPYIFQPALARYLERFKRLETIEDEGERYEALRRLPSLESGMESINESLASGERLSLAQRSAPRALAVSSQRKVTRWKASFSGF